MRKSAKSPSLYPNRIYFDRFARPIRLRLYCFVDSLLIALVSILVPYPLTWILHSLSVQFGLVFIDNPILFALLYVSVCVCVFLFTQFVFILIWVTDHSNGEPHIDDDWKINETNTSALFFLRSEYYTRSLVMTIPLQLIHISS